MAKTTSELPGWLPRLPVPEQQRFVALSLQLLQTDAALRTVFGTGPMEWAAVSNADPRAVASAMRASAVHVREQAGLLESLGRSYDDMASILESIAD